MEPSRRCENKSRENHKEGRSAALRIETPDFDLHRPNTHWVKITGMHWQCAVKGLCSRRTPPCPTLSGFKLKVRSFWFKGYLGLSKDRNDCQDLWGGRGQPKLCLESLLASSPLSTEETRKYYTPGHLISPAEKWCFLAHVATGCLVIQCYTNQKITFII